MLREGRDEAFIKASLKDRGMDELLAKGVMKQADEVWYTMQMARKRIIEGAGIAALSIGGYACSFFTPGNSFALLYGAYGAAALGLGLVFRGFWMKRKTRHYL